MNRAQLIALKEKVEKAKGPSLGIDETLWRDIAPDEMKHTGAIFAPPFTETIDAALSLVDALLPNLDWALSKRQGFALRKKPTDEELDRNKWPIIFEATCKTPVLSIVAALLSAVIAKTPENVDA